MMSHARYTKPLLAALILFSFSWSLAAHADDTKKYLHIQAVKSDSGIEAWLVEDHSLPIIAMDFAFEDAGAKNDPHDKQGLARLASNTMDEGADNITSQEFQKTLQDLSISLSFNVDRDNFGGSVKTLSRNKDKAFDLLRLALNAPRFDEEPLNRMRDANISRLRASMTDPEWIAARLQNDRIFENSPYALNSGGTISGLRAITAEDLKAFHKTLGKNILKISVAGDITPEELKKILDTVFSPLPAVERKTYADSPLANTGKTYLFEQDIPQTIIEIAQKGINRNDPDYYAAQVMNFILGSSGFGSRLMEEVREKRGLTYGIYTYFRQNNQADTLQVSTSTVNKSVDEVLSIIHDEWKKMTDGPIGEKELKDAKSYIIGSLPLSLTSTDAISGVMLSMQLDHLPPDYLDTRAQKINALTTEDIQNVAKKLLNDKSFTTILVGKPENINDAILIKDLPNVE